MNKLRTGVALILTGFFVVACGRGFEPMKLKTSSTGAAVNEVKDPGTPVGQSLPGDNSIVDPFAVSQGTTEQITPQLWPDAQNGGSDTAFEDNWRIGNVIKGIKVVFIRTSDPLTSEQTRDVYAQIANSCINKSLTGETVEARINFEYLQRTPNLIINIGESDNYKLRWACTDSECKNATLYVTAKRVPIQDFALGRETEKVLSAAVYMERVGNSGTYVPGVNPKGDKRYIALGSFPDYKKACTGSDSTQQQQQQQQQLPDGIDNDFNPDIF